MTNDEKRLIVESVGLCWHEVQETTIPSEIIGQPESFICSCGKTLNSPSTMEMHIVIRQLDPLDLADMYGKIWPAFRKMEGECRKFLDWLNPEVGAGGYHNFNHCIIDVGYLEAPDLAQALLEYSTERKEKKDADGK